MHLTIFLIVSLSSCDDIHPITTSFKYLGLNFSPEIATKMQAFLDSVANDERHGKHAYTLESSGLNLDAERARFADYQTAYSIPSETSRSKNLAIDTLTLSTRLAQAPSADS